MGRGTVLSASLELWGDRVVWRWAPLRRARPLWHPGLAAGGEVQHGRGCFGNCVPLPLPQEPGPNRKAQLF